MLKLYESSLQVLSILITPSNAAEGLTFRDQKIIFIQSESPQVVGEKKSKLLVDLSDLEVRDDNKSE
jgi:hypothetical protein